MNFLELLICAKAGDNEAAERILTMYQPILVKESVLDGALDEDLYQELCLQLFLCIRKFRIYSCLNRKDASFGASFFSYGRYANGIHSAARDSSNI